MAGSWSPNGKQSKNYRRSSLMISFSGINLLAVLSAGVITFFLGAVWYMPLFGKLWIKLHGYSEEKVKKMQARLAPAVFFGGMLASYLLIALVVGALVVSLGLKEPLEGAFLGVLLWLIVAAVGFTAYLASDKHIGIYAIDTGYQLTFLLFMGVLLSMWRI
jgi:hypothetical protein